MFYKSFRVTDGAQRALDLSRVYSFRAIHMDSEAVHLVVQVVDRVVASQQAFPILTSAAAVAAA